MGFVRKIGRKIDDEIIQPVVNTVEKIVESPEALLAIAALAVGVPYIPGVSELALAEGAAVGLTAAEAAGLGLTAAEATAAGLSAAEFAAASAGTAGAGAGLLSGAGAGTSLGTGLTAGSSGLGLTAGGSGLGITAASSGAGAIGGSLGTTLAGVSTGIGSVGATALAADIASKGLFSGALAKAAEITGLSEATLGQLGVAGVQTLLSGSAAKSTAEAATEAARIQSNAQIEAAKIAADAAKFRPVGVTTRFGSSKFDFDEKGNLTNAGYKPSAEISGYQDRLRTLASQGLTDVEGARAAYQPLTGAAQSLFNLGGQYLAKSPADAAADYIAKQRALIAPSRETQLADIRNKQFQQGRSGAAVAQGGGLMATSPELAAYFNSLATQDLTLAAQADQEARDQIKFGSSLYDTGSNLQGRFYSGQTAAYQPFATAMDTTAGLERLAAEPLALGTSIGARTTAGSAEAGRLLSGGITSAAATMAPANAYSLTGDVLGGAARSQVLKSAIDSAFGVQPQGGAFTDAQKAQFFDKYFSRPA